MACAVRNGNLWELKQPELVGTTKDLFQRLQNRKKTPGCLFVGLDFPIGLPKYYGEKTGFSNFRNALRNFGCDKWKDWYSVCETHEEISITRPFYPMRPGGTEQKHLLDGLMCETPEQLLRICERKTSNRNAACMLFWTLGGNQVGKAAISGWRELLAPNFDVLGLWPFDGQLHELFAQFDIVIAETYPGDAYGQLGIPRYPRWSKRKRAGRQSISQHLLNWLSSRPVSFHARLDSNIRHGFSENSQGKDKFGEDKFDATVGLFCMLDVVCGRIPENIPGNKSITRWEGWILGQEFNI